LLPLGAKTGTMSSGVIPDELLDHLTRTSGLTRSAATRVVEEVLRYYSETTQQYVRRRHRELQAAGATNPVILATISSELNETRVLPPELTERQLRRIVYG
jgi:hypothetical protein